MIPSSEITGDTTGGFTEADLDGDFDPKAYDAAMQKVFTDDYYSTQRDEEKPVFSDSGEEGQWWASFRVLRRRS